MEQTVAMLFLSATQPPGQQDVFDFPEHAVDECDDDDPHLQVATVPTSTFISLVACVVSFAWENRTLLFSEEDDNDESHRAPKPRISPTVPRKRCHNIAELFDQLGPSFTRRAFRMTAESFFRLHELLLPSLGCELFPPATSTKSHRNGARNGLIPSTTRLAVALRFFAGGSPYDLSLVYGMSLTEVYCSAWRVVHAINHCHVLRIEFPSNHQQQQRLAAGFQESSAAGFDCCVAAIDGMLIWTECPSKRETEKAKIGPKKFYCGRKKKFGLNMMGTVDYMCRFLDVQISHPGSTSDFLAFATSDLKALLERPGFLAPGLVLFGDNAYANSEYMVTPYKGNLDDSKDAFNFFHSQLLIKVECAFGRLVHRWGILRRPLSMKFGFRKTNHLVMALCRLHNFCINDRETTIASALGDGLVPPPLGEDQVYTDLHSGIEDPSELLHGGEHFNDINRNARRRCNRVRQRTRLSPNKQPEILPQESLRNTVVNRGLRRPTPKRWL
jgi:hypothetical protein